MKMMIWMFFGMMILGTILIATAQTPAYIIDGDKVFINNSKAYIATYPVISRGGTVHLELLSKVYTGDLTMAWGFNTSIAKPKNPMLYKPYNLTTEHNYTCNYEVRIDTINKRAECYIEHPAIIGNSTLAWNETIFNHSYTRKHNPSKTIWWSETKQFDYVDFPLDLSPVSFEYLGADTWYITKRVPVVEDVLYKMKFYLDIVFNPKGVSGKYNFCTYPSSYGRNIVQAEADGKLYCVDPWFDTENFSFRRNITCTNLDDGEPFIVNGSAGFNLDGITQLIWTTCQGTGMAVYYNDNTDCIIANDTTQLPSESENSTCPSFNPESVWDGTYTGVYHLSSDLFDSTSNDNDGSTHGATFRSDSHVGFGAVMDGNDDYINTTIIFNNSQDFSMSCWYNSTQTSQYATYFGNYDDGGAPLFGMLARTDTISGEGIFLLARTTTTTTVIEPNVNDGNWHHIAFTYEDSGGTWNIYFDGRDVGGMTHTYVNNAQTLGLAIGGYTSEVGKTVDKNWLGDVDECRITNNELTASQVNQSYENIIGTSGYGDLGIEENVPVVDPCAYGGFGDFVINDDCTITSDQNILGNDVLINATVRNDATLSNFGSFTNADSFVNAGAVN